MSVLLRPCPHLSRFSQILRLPVTRLMDRKRIDLRYQQIPEGISGINFLFSNRTF